MMSLFSPFDIFFNAIPMFVFTSLLVFLLNFFYKINSATVLVSELKLLMKFFFSLKAKSFSKFSMVIFLSLMLGVMVINFISVFPFSFPFSSSFGSILTFSVAMWLSFIIFSVVMNFKGFICHLIPEGTPIFLTFILFMIELISSIIRPITLSVRLVANILAGHLLMILLSKLIFSNFTLLPFYVGLNMVELFVALIQSYIFCTMITLYFSEIH